LVVFALLIAAISVILMGVLPSYVLNPAQMSTLL